MNAGKIGDSLVANTGNIAKAVIEIEDCRGIKISEQEAVALQGSAGAKLGAVLRTVKEGQSVVNFAVKKSTKSYTLQFNPSSLALQARGSGYMNIMAFDTEGKGTDPSKQEVRIFFSVQLIIDQEDNFDAFLEDKMNVSPTQLGQNIAKGIMKAKTGKEPTVKDTVEAFIFAIRSPYTREIAFNWGKMRYHGELNRVQAEYVMFNRKGQPVRAHINLTIQCYNEDPYPNSLGEWEEAYQKAFSGSELRSAGMSQKLGSVLNLG